MSTNTDSAELDQRLLSAAEEGDLAAITTLLEQAAEPAYQNEEGVSPLMLASKNGHLEVVRKLLESGAPWNALDKDGKCAGEYAWEGQQDEVAQELIDHGCRAEMILGIAEKRSLGMRPNSYLDQSVEYQEDKLLDEQGLPVMMEWERPIMEAHAASIAQGGEGEGVGDLLNIGFGMGIVDEAIQKHKPKSHTIIEAHPAVYQRMIEAGWDKKPNVRIVFGKWQEELPKLGKFDGIFYDTYGEYYADMQELHQLLPSKLNKEGIYSFYNGLAADNPFFYVVYCQIAQLELSRLGLECTMIQLPVQPYVHDKETWGQISNRYWCIDTYCLIVCQLMEQRQQPEEHSQPASKKMKSGELLENQANGVHP
eukprot:TRINITY_DN1106_c0_g1_i13.p1 TRINITY_DN1106_c0_g1~~TRINITY_DN1106_c0_g1_i13.p1  ORF type:complete len:367 (-),score=41.46 TRINITY_DN1106_c0_g1_i13:672-1772(-)